ncbi:hypothetical protein BH11PLA1_BH11PLA1_18520 [soil metagenome]
MVLTRISAGRQLVAQRCALCARAGIRVGMDMTQARALLTGRVPLYIEPHRPQRNSEALHRLAHWATRIAPTVAPDGPDTLVCDLSGTQRLYKGEARVLRSAARALRRMGFSVRAAVAPTWGCAWAVARWSTRELTLVPPGAASEVLAPLPPAALRLEAGVLASLAEIGIRRIEELLRLSRPALAARFGLDTLARIDRALGAAPEHIEPVRTPVPVRAEMIFDGATDRWDALEAAARLITVDLAHELAQREQGARHVAIQVPRPHGPPAETQVLLSRPCRNVKHLWALVRAQLERIDVGAGVTGIALTAVRTARLAHVQLASPRLGASAAGPERAESQGQLVDALAARLGSARVLRVQEVPSHIPERAVRMSPALEPCEIDATSPEAQRAQQRQRRAKAARTRSHGARLLAQRRAEDELRRATHGVSTGEIAAISAFDQIVAATPRPPERVDLPIPELSPAARDAVQIMHRVRPVRPTTLFAAPHPVQVMALTPDGPVLSIDWQGKRQRVLACRGPERISPEWWRWGSTKGQPRVLLLPPDRDYFAIEIEDGRWLWVCRQLGTTRWFAHGEWG